jgi:hypothetical protein
MPRIEGPFEVRVTPQPADARPAAAFLARLSLDKRFSGSLEATSVGQMLANAPSPEGSAVYVAIEQVTGSLDGRSGSFVLHHTGIAERGANTLTITVAPDSGTGDLAGISGMMKIDIAADGSHSYVFDYTLPG